MRNEREGVRRKTEGFLAKVIPHPSSLILCAFAAFAANAQEWKPARNVDIAIASGAGGAADRQGRQLQKLLLQAVPGFPSITVTNKPGGGGLVAWTSLAQHGGDAHFIATLSTALLTNQILGIGPVDKVPEVLPAIQKGLALAREGKVVVIDARVLPGYDRGA